MDVEARKSGHAKLEGLALMGRQRVASCLDDSRHPLDSVAETGPLRCVRPAAESIVRIASCSDDSATAQVLSAARVWLVSMVVHAVALAALSGLTVALAPARVPELVLAVSAEPANLETPESLEVTLPDEVPVGNTAFHDAPGAVSDVPGGIAAVPTLIENFALVTSQPGEGPSASVKGAPQVDTKSTAGQGAEFYGIQADGVRFVFVVDCSYSMTGPRWAGAVEELEAAVRKLGPHREFYVILFDGLPHLMFNDTAADVRLMPATPENVASFERWVERAPLGNNTAPLEAVKFALGLRPDAIYLLTDGEFRDKTASYLKRHNRGDGTQPATIIHTIALHGRKGQRTLKQIANSSGGTYRYVPNPFEVRTVVKHLTGK